MNIIQKVVARRYAIAYVETFDDHLNKDIILAVKQAIPFFKRHAQALYFLTLPTITREQKVAVMADIMQKLQMPVSLNRLLDMLIHHKRAWLWCDVLDMLVSYYYQKHNIVTASVESFPELSEYDKQAIEQSFARMLKKDALYTYQVRPELIAGVCIKADNLRWEYSIAKKLQAIRSSVLEPYKG